MCIINNKVMLFLADICYGVLAIASSTPGIYILSCLI